MSVRYLFGPVDAAFADKYLCPARRSRACLTFDRVGGADLTFGPNDSWETICAALPAGWEPDFVVLHLAYRDIPSCLWSAPVPLVGLAPDWNWLYHGYRRILPLCDLVLTDTAGMAVFRAEGFRHVRTVNLFGCERAFLEESPAEHVRPIDVLFVGNLQPAVQRERLPWLGRLARLADRWRIVIATNVFGQAYRSQLRQSRIVFNRSARGECNMRAFEAAACGALLFQEAGNLEVPAYFRDRQECVFYSDDDFETLLSHYLTHDEERRVIAESAKVRVQEYGFHSLWGEAISGLATEWKEPQERAKRRENCKGTSFLLARAGLAMACPLGPNASLLNELRAAAEARPGMAALQNALGLVEAMNSRQRNVIGVEAAEQAAPHFQRALHADPQHVAAALNLIECFVGLGRKQEACDWARQLLHRLEHGTELDFEGLDAGHFPPAFDFFRVEWERAAWEHAGNPEAEVQAKRDLVSWRLHAVLSELTGDLVHHQEAVRARPDLPTTRAELGRALLRAGRPADAAPHLRQAVVANPFDQAAARDLFRALKESDDSEGVRKLVQDRRLLTVAAPGLVKQETWFATTETCAGSVLLEPSMVDEDRPGTQQPFATPANKQAPTDLCSIIILCCNEVEYTRLCIESVLRHTRTRYELVLVDNGSTDGTASYLESLGGRAGPERILLLHNPCNRGYAAGCNQGLSKASGRYIVFLNNDTIVAAGWLDGLLNWARHPSGSVGLVGAVTNYAAAPQQVAADYADLEGFTSFANSRRREFAGQALEVERLVGFCLLARREVLNAVGAFDERYGLGFFEDDDLCIRAREARYKLLIALDVFVHHFGSQTFKGLGVDRHRLLRENFGRFREKWGEERTSGYRLTPPTPGGHAMPSADPDCVIPFAPKVSLSPRPNAARVSVCMIVRNEESNLPDCLGSVADLVDEIIVVDTGSSDGTRAAAARFGAGVYDFAWIDNFAAARNESLRHATCPWIFWLDADESLDEANRTRFRQLLRQLGDESVAYVMRQLSVPKRPAGSATAVDQVRLFRNHPDLRWQYRVHEQILLAIRQRGDAVRWTDVVIRHTGYQDLESHRRKRQRNLQLMEQEASERPDDPFLWFNLGWTYQQMGRLSEALPLLHRCRDALPTDVSIVRKLHAIITNTYRQLGQPAEALAACREGLSHFRDDIELLFLEGILLREGGELALAEQAFLKLLHTQPVQYFAMVDPDLSGYKARHNLALVYREQKRWKEAESLWRAVLAEQPECRPALAGLNEALMAQMHRQTSAEVLGDSDALQMACVPVSPPDAAGDNRHAPLPRDSSTTLEEADSGAVTIPGRCCQPGFRRMRTSLCMIVKNEISNLPGCLESAQGLFDEIIIVDTGSSDGTQEIAIRMGGRVFDFPWQDSFAVARNESLRHATGDWIFWLDADDRLDEVNRERLRTLLESLKDENAAYAMKCLCLPDPETRSETAVDHIRLFRTHPDLRWSYRVHEQILPAIRARKGEVRFANVVIHHVGYKDARLRQCKLDRDLRLLKLEHAELGDEPFTLFNLGAVYHELGRHAEALPMLRQSLALSKPADSIVRKLYALIAACHRSQGQLVEALLACAEGRQHYPDDSELLFAESLLRRRRGDLAGAETCLLYLKSVQPAPHFASVDTGLKGYKAHHNLGVIYQEQGRLADAEVQWRAAVGERADFLPAWLALGDQYLKTGRPKDVAAVIKQLEAFPRFGLEATVLRARLHLAHAEFGPAKSILYKVIAQHPRELWPRVILSHVLLQEGLEWDAAEEALRDVLALAPDNDEARRNLAVLLQRLGRLPDRCLPGDERTDRSTTQSAS